MEIRALDEYIEALSRLEKDKVQEIISASIYEGAGMVADEIKKEMKNLPVASNMHYGVTKDEKEDMIDGFGISPMQKLNDDHNVKIGFSGYSQRRSSKKYSKGIPIPLIARSIISGTSFRVKNDFVRRAVNRIRKKSIEKMDNVINEKIKEEMK